MKMSCPHDFLWKCINSDDNLSSKHYLTANGTKSRNKPYVEQSRHIASNDGNSTKSSYDARVNAKPRPSHV